MYCNKCDKETLNELNICDKCKDSDSYIQNGKFPMFIRLIGYFLMLIIFIYLAYVFLKSAIYENTNWLIGLAVMLCVFSGTLLYRMFVLVKEIKNFSEDDTDIHCVENTAIDYKLFYETTKLVSNRSDLKISEVANILNVDAVEIDSIIDELVQLKYVTKIPDNTTNDTVISDNGIPYHFAAFIAQCNRKKHDKPYDDEIY